MQYTWTQTLTSEQVEAIKALIPGHLVRTKAQHESFLAGDLPEEIDRAAYAEALAFHARLDAFILAEWERSVTVENGVATATIDWSAAPTDDSWELPFIRDRVWNTIRDVPLGYMRPRLLIEDPENGQAKFDFYHSLLEAVDAG